MIDQRLAVGVCFLSLLAGAAPPEKGVEPESPAMVFSRVSGTVVLIRVQTPRGEAQGSGVIVAKGKVVTNLHVVAGATRITVSLKGKEAGATVFATSKPARDLALLSVDTTGASRASLRKSSELVVGDRVFAVGNPRGYEQTLTEGLVSALRKEGDAFVVQTSAAISPGSSGGGLFDTRGRLVGITTKSRTDGQSLNFANPVEWVTELLAGASSSDAGVVAPGAFSVSERPEAALCEFTEAARWGIFSEGIELLESSPTTGRMLLTALDTTQPVMGTGAASASLVLKDMSRKTQVALFRGGPEEALIFTSFEESGDVRVTLAWVVSERGEARLVTHSGLCETGTSASLKAQLSKVVPEQLPNGQDVCEVDPGTCYALATQRQGGERFLLLKKACRLGHFLACGDAIKLAEGVSDKGNVTLLQRYRETAKPMEKPSSEPAPAVQPPSGGKRKPLKATE